MKKAIGILGGMGPEASVYMYKLLIEKAITEFGAKHNDEFPEILLHSIPVPDFISSNEEQEKALLMLQERVKLLNMTNISCLAIACNTAHVLLGDLQKVSAVPFVSMIDEVASSVSHDGLRVVGILGTPSTIRANLYQKAMKSKGIRTVEPTKSQLGKLEKVIRNVIAGKTMDQDKAILLQIADTLKVRGVQGIVLGCTELPLVFPDDYPLPVFNSVAILARKLLGKYYMKEKVS